MTNYKEIKDVVKTAFSQLSKLEIEPYYVSSEGLDDKTNRIGLHVISDIPVDASYFTSDTPSKGSKSGRLSFSLLMEYSGFDSGVTNPDLGSITLDGDRPNVRLNRHSDSSQTPSIFFIDTELSAVIMPTAYQAFVQHKDNSKFRAQLMSVCNAHVAQVKEMPFF